jgi:benzoyl-CoA reductase/2-hydroxyglutaryl-CoA dehydratase subunit BcrC/BadD/HgdB
VGRGGKAIGFFCSYIPEEIIYAAGFLPFRIRPQGYTETSQADAHMSIYNCSFARSCLEFALKGEYQSLAGMVSMNSCDHIRRLYDVWQEKVTSPYMYFLSVPHKITDEAVDWYKQELVKFKESLEKAFNIQLTESKLREAIKVYNHTRELLKRVYNLRKRERPPLSGTQMHHLFLAAANTPKPHYNHLLEQLLHEIATAEGISDYRARLMIVGSVHDDPHFTQTLEEVGGLVVADALCFGSRYFWEPVAEDGDPLMALAQSYLRRPACARMAGGGHQRVEFIKEMVKEFNVAGVIYQVIRNCDLWGGEAFYIERELKESNIPSLRLEREYTLTGVEGIKSRVEAFLEIIEG